MCFLSSIVSKTWASEVPCDLLCVRHFSCYKYLWKGAVRLTWRTPEQGRTSMTCRPHYSCSPRLTCSCCGGGPAVWQRRPHCPFPPAGIPPCRHTLPVDPSWRGNTLCSPPDSPGRSCSWSALSHNRQSVRLFSFCFSLSMWVTLLNIERETF